MLMWKENHCKHDNNDMAASEDCENLRHLFYIEMATIQFIPSIINSDNRLKYWKHQVHIPFTCRAPCE